MKSLRTIALALSLQASMALVAHATPAANNDPYDRLAEVAHRVCGETPMSGTTGSIGGSLDADTTLSNVLKWLGEVKLGGRLKAGQHWHAGLRQQDIPASQAITVSCSERVFDHMFDALLLTDRLTGRRIVRPADLHTTYASTNAKSSKVLQSAPIIVENNSGIITDHQTGNNTVINPPVPHYPDGLYIGDLEVGNVQGMSIAADGSLVFHEMTFFNGQDPRVALSFQGRTIICDINPQEFSKLLSGFGGPVRLSLSYSDKTCRLMG